MAEYRLFRRNLENDRGWIPTTKGDRHLITMVLNKNLKSRELRNMDWKVERIRKEN